jgi:hypothetical protein
MAIFFNGIKVASKSTSVGPYTATTGLSLGASYFKGELSDFMIFSRILRESEIKALYKETYRQ